MAETFVTPEGTDEEMETGLPAEAPQNEAPELPPERIEPPQLVDPAATPFDKDIQDAEADLDDLREGGDYSHKVSLDDDLTATYGSIAGFNEIRAKNGKLTEEQELEESQKQTELLELLELGTFQNTTMQTVRIGAQNFAAGVVARPSWMDEEDPNFVPPIDELTKYDDVGQDLLLGAKNQKHYEYLKSQADFMKNYNDKFQNTDLYTWLGASGYTFIVESGQIMAVTAAGAYVAGPAGAAVGLGSAINKLKQVTFGIKNARLAWMARQAAAGAAGASAEAIAAYSQGVIDAQGAMQYPLYGAAGGAVLSGAGQLMYKMRGFDADGKPLYQQRMAPDPEVHATVQTNRAAAIELAARRDAGQIIETDAPPIKKLTPDDDVDDIPDRPDTPELEKKQKGEDYDPEQADIEAAMLREYENQVAAKQAKGDENIARAAEDAAPHPAVTKTFLEKDVRIRLRPKGTHQTAVKYMKEDTGLLRPVMSQMAEGLKLTGRKLKKAREAYTRQGYQNEIEQVVFAKVNVDGEVDLASGFTSRASAADDAVKVVLKPGTRILHSDDIDGSTIAKTIMFGDGTLKPSGKGRYEFVPNEKLEGGTPSITGGKHPHGADMDEGEIAASAKFADEAADDYDWESLYTANSSAGAAANIVPTPQRLAVEVNQIVDQYARASTKDVHRGHNLGSTISRIKRLKASMSATLRNNLRGITGAADAVTDANFDKNKGSSWDMRKDADDKADGAIIEQERKKRFKSWQKEVREKKIKDQYGKPLAYRGDRGLSNFLQMHKEYAYHLEAAREYGVSMPKNLEGMESLKGSEAMFNKMLKEKLDYAQDPTKRMQDGIEREGVAHAKDIKYYDNHTVRQQDHGKINELLDQNPRAIEELYTELIHNRNLRTNPNADPEAARRIAYHIQEAYIIGRGNVEDAFQRAFAGAKTAKEAIEMLRNSDLGLPESTLTQLEVEFNALKAGATGSADFFNSRMKLNAVQEVKIPYIDKKTGQQQGYVGIRLMDIMEDDMYLTLNRYAETANGWIHGALTPIVDINGKPLMTKITKGEGKNAKEIEVPVTFNSKGRIQMFKDMVKREKGARREKDIQKVSGSNAGVENQSDEAILDRFFDYLINESGENPHEVASIAKALATIYTMGHGGISSMQEIGAVIAFGRAQGVAAIAESMGRGLMDLGSYVVRLGREGKLTEDAMDDWNDEIMRAGMGVNMDNMRLRETLAAGDKAFSFGQINPNATMMQKFGRAVNKGQNFILQKGLQAPVTDWTEKLSARAVQRRWKKKFEKVNSFEELPLRDRDYWLRTGISRDLMNRIIKMHKSGDVYTVEGSFMDRRHNINKSSQNFDANAHQEYVFAIKWLVNNRMIQSNQYAAGIAGSDKGFLIPALKHLKSFTLHGVTQQLDPMLRDWARDGKGLWEKARAGNHSLHDGSLNHLVGLATHGGTLITMGFLAALTRYISDKARNWDKDDDWHKAHHNDFWTANRIMQIGIDRAGPLASIPMAYDATLGWAVTGKDWNGFDIENPFQDVPYGSSIWTPVESFTTAGDAALEAGAKGFSGDNIRKMGKALGSWWGSAQAVNIMAETAEYLGAPETHGKSIWNPAKMDTPFEALAEKWADPLKKEKTFDFDKWKGNKRKDNIATILGVKSSKAK